MDIQLARDSLSPHFGFHAPFKRIYCHSSVMWFTDCLVSVVSVSEPPMKQENIAEENRNNSHEKYLDVSISKPVMEVLKVGVNTTTSYTHTKSNLFGLFVTTVLPDYLHRSHCGQSVSSGSRGMILQSLVRGGPCRQPQSCCLEVTSSPPLWLWCPPCKEMQRKKYIAKKTKTKHAITTTTCMYYSSVYTLHQIRQF